MVITMVITWPFVAILRTRMPEVSYAPHGRAGRARSW